LTQDNSDIRRSNITLTRDTITVTTSSGAYNWTFGVTGNLSVPGNTNIITASATGGSAGNSISIVAGAADQTNFYTTAGGNVNIVGGLGATNDGGGGGPGGDVNLTSGLSADPAGHAGNVNIDTGDYNWVFDFNGQLNLPGGTGYIGSSANNISIYSDTAETNGMLFYDTGSEVYSVGDFKIFADNAGSGNTWNFAANAELQAPGAITTAGNISAGNFIGDGSNVDIVAGAYDWIFGNTGILFVPGEGVIRSLDDTVTLQSFNTGTGFANSVYVGTSGGLGFADASIGSNWLEIFRSGTDPQIATPGNLTIVTDSTNTAHTWDFDNTGNLTLPGNITGNTGGFAIGYRDIPQVTFSANATAALTDAGKHYYSTTAGNLALTLPDNSSVSFPTGAALTVVVNAAGNVLVNQGTGVSLYMAGSSTTGNRVVGAYGLASVMKVAANTWVISGTGVY